MWHLRRGKGRRGERGRVEQRVEKGRGRREMEEDKAEQKLNVEGEQRRTGV